MEEKYMINDVLNSLKYLIKKYSDAIVEVENIDLREILQKTRNLIEESQYNLYIITKSKGYYLYEEEAQKEEIEKVKYELNIH